MNTLRLLMFAGSARRTSFNQQLIHAAAVKAKLLGSEVEVVDLADYDIPIFNQDLEADSFPPAVRVLREKIMAADGILLGCPEYNGSITPLLKNIIDWTSRPQEGVADGMIAYQGLVAGLVAASPGGLGGLRGLVHVRAILSGIGVHVIPQEMAVGSAHQAFGADGSLASEAMNQRLEDLLECLIRTAKALQKS